MAVNNDSSCLEIVSDYSYPGTGGCPLAEILESIRGQLVEAQFAPATLTLHNEHLDRLSVVAGADCPEITGYFCPDLTG